MTKGLVRIHPRTSNKSGFTLIEYIMYIGITSVVLLAAFSFVWTIINNQVKMQVLIEVDNNGTFVLEKLSYYTKRADTIDATTVYDSNPGKLVINYATDPQITFDTYEKEITLGDSSVMITKLRMKIGADPAEDITSDGVDVTNFVLTDFSVGQIKTINFDLTIESVNPSGSQKYAAENSWTTTVTVRAF